MRSDDLTRFALMLADVMGSYGKPLPDSPMVNTWFRHLQAFRPEVIAQAFAEYSMERPDFAPVPNSIAARCRLLDGRPDENEAWALARNSASEWETVVWTGEMEAAFSAARPLLAAGDDVGARMAFKDAYVRLVSEARAANRPTTWNVSPGWDLSRKRLVIAAAVRAGQLPAPKAAALLPGITDDNDSEEDRRPEQLKRLKELVATLEDAHVKSERQRQALLEAEEARKAEIQAQVEAYTKSHPERRQEMTATENRKKPDQGAGA